ncbi:MAG: TerC family protein [Alphaproteobacteria bacterium]|nr:TerC family protein [Alphaproteobacteria bacterium]
MLILLNTEFLVKPVWAWLAFAGLVGGLIAFDLGVLHKKTHEINIKESLWLSVFYISVGLLFGVWVWFELGHQKGMEYLTGFVVEKTLAMDNIFVIAMIFSYFGIPRLYQHRVLIYGIVGVLILRGIMIGLGAALVTQFSWVLYIFAAFLIYTGFKMFFIDHDAESDIGNNMLLRFLKKHFRTTDKLDGEKFLTRIADPVSGKVKTYMTPLLVTLVMIEFADVIFAVDSIPAIFAITTDPYIVYTSNVFAILGLRALYFALAAMLSRFAYLKYALSLVLIFIGSKVLIADFLGLQKFPPELSLGITVAILAAGFGYSLWKTRKQA